MSWGVSRVTSVVSLVSCRSAAKMRMVTAVKRQRMKTTKMTLKKQRRMRMTRRKCCYQAWRGKRRCTPYSCVLQHLGDTQQGLT